MSSFDVSCVVHVHSRYSDGTASVPELLAAARETGADALLLTDHDSLQARRDGWEGEHDGVFLLVGCEVTSAQGHYLAFGVEEEIPHRGCSAVQIADAVRAVGGIGFAAHPFSTGGHMLMPALARRIVLPHAWPAIADAGGCDGIELWSLTTDAAEAWRSPAQAVRWLRDPQAAVAHGPPADHLARWDELSARRRLPAIGGLDAHQHGLRVRGHVYSPLSNRTAFALMRTHLLCDRPLSGELHADRVTLLRALAGGAAWLHCPFVAPAEGARLWAEQTGRQPIPMGGEAPAGPTALCVRLPRIADVEVFRDGATLHQARTQELEFGVELPGVYRIQARINDRLWLLSNPVHLRARASRPACVP